MSLCLMQTALSLSCGELGVVDGGVFPGRRLDSMISECVVCYGQHSNLIFGEKKKMGDLERFSGAGE
jgi:hypothetical protein